jgi:hypothetical protein
MTGRQIFKRDELQLGIHLTGEIPPLSTSLLWSVNGIDNNIVPQSELLSGQGRYDEPSCSSRIPAVRPRRSASSKFVTSV